MSFLFTIAASFIGGKLKTAFGSVRHLNNLDHAVNDLLGLDDVCGIIDPDATSGQESASGLARVAGLAIANTKAFSAGRRRGDTGVYCLAIANKNGNPG